LDDFSGRDGAFFCTLPSMYFDDFDVHPLFLLAEAVVHVYLALEYP
jgi:hypothetical protein